MFSSTNCGWVKVAVLGKERPLNCWEWRASLMYCLRPSSIMTKIKGERGSPCWMPLEGWKGVEGIPLINIEKKVQVIRLITHLTQGGVKPNANNIFWMYFQLKLSKALERSIFRSIPSFLSCFKEWMISWVSIMPSMICLSSTYPDCSGDISNGTNVFSHVVIALETILYMTLQRPIGQNLFEVWQSSSLGIRAMNVAFKEGSIHLLVLDSSTTFHTSSLIRPQKLWKKSDVNPSGPGAFLL